MGKQQEKAAAAKRKLLAAAAELFGTNEIAKVGVREICAHAGVTTGTFYHYYSGKDHIIDCLYRKRDAAFGLSLKQLSENPPYVEGIVSFFADNLARTVKEDGIDFTRHRLFTMRKRSRGDMELYIGMDTLVELAVKNGELAKELDVKKVRDYLFLVFRGVLYEWCISADEDRFDVQAAMRPAIACALRAFTCCERTETVIPERER